MSSKGKRRREARRRARQQQQEQRPERAPETESVAATGSAQAAAGAEAGHSRARRKRAKRRNGLWEQVRRTRVSPWLITVPVVAVGVGILAMLVLGSGSSETTRGAAEEALDPRVVGLTPAKSFEIVAGDDGVNPAANSFFEPDTFSANAGDVVEFVVTNEGSVTHNLWLAGPDNEYETDDDFGPQPLILPGETGRLVVKMDEPGTYLFRCQIHPGVQTGTLILG